MRSLLSVFAIAFFLVGTALAANLNLYKGTWINPASAPRIITNLKIRVIDSKAHVHAFGKLRPKKDHDWGWGSASSYADGHLSVRYRKSNCLCDLTITLRGNRLVVKTHTHYTDGSGRPDKDDTDTLRRLLQPANPTPRPMGKVHPKPVNSTPTGKY